MKNLMIGFILIGITLSSCYSQEIDCSIEALNEQLIEIRQKDQSIRTKLMPVLAQYQKDGSGQMKLFSLAMKMEKQDEENQQVIKSIFEQCGWPESLSAEAHGTIFLVLQHAPDELMRQYYPQVSLYAEKGLLEPNDQATMFDRLQMRAGKYQRFGTQTFQDDQNRNLVWPIEDVEALQERRDSVGLPSMEAYLKFAKDSTGVEMYWNKELSLKEAIELRSKH